MNCSIQLGFASLNRTFHLSPHENICTIALITIHYLYNIDFPFETPTAARTTNEIIAKFDNVAVWEKRNVLFSIKDASYLM